MRRVTIALLGLALLQTAKAASVLDSPDTYCQSLASNNRVSLIWKDFASGGQNIIPVRSLPTEKRAVYKGEDFTTVESYVRYLDAQGAAKTRGGFTALEWDKRFNAYTRIYMESNTHGFATVVRPISKSAIYVCTFYTGYYLQLPRP